MKPSERIAAARKILEPSPEKLRHVLIWLKEQVLARIGRPRFCSASRAILQRTIRVADPAFDHLDSKKWGDNFALVSEPYLSRSEVDAEMRLAAQYGPSLVVSPNSHWYQGSTTRLPWLPCTEVVS